MLKYEAKKFISATNHINSAKTIINECKRLILDFDLGVNDCKILKECINKSYIDDLVNKVETTKNSIFEIDHDFAQEYVSLLEEYLTTSQINTTYMSEEAKMEYLNSQKDYDRTLLYMLEYYEKTGCLTDEMKQQLEYQRELVAQYDLMDEMSLLDPLSDEYVELYKKCSEMDKNLIKLHPSLTEEQKESYLKDYETRYNESLNALLDAKAAEEKRKADELELQRLYEEEGTEAYLQKKAEMGLATEEELEYLSMGFWEKTWENTKTFGVSVFTGLGSVGETIVDGAVMFAGGVAAGRFGTDTQWAEDFVSMSITKDAYDGTVYSGAINSVSAYSGWHTAGEFIGSTAGYISLSFIPGGGLTTGSIGALTAMGSTSQRAFDSGASFNEAFKTGAIEAGVGFFSGYLLGNINKNALQSTKSFGDIGKNVLKGMGVSLLEPTTNTIAEYAIYAKDMVDENGNHVYSNIFDYYVKSGGIINTAMAITIGGFSSGFTSTIGYKNNISVGKLSANIERPTIIGTPEELELLNNRDQLFKTLLGDVDPSVEAKIQRIVELYNESQTASIDKYNVGFKSYRDHTTLHAYYVGKYAKDLASNVSDIDIDDTMFAALVHDLGMKGGYVKYKGADIDLGDIKIKSGDYVQADVILNYTKSTGAEISFDDINVNIRKPHPLNSAITVLSDDVIPDGLDKDVIALLAMSHSKSTSGISYFDNKKQWLNCVDELDSALAKYNIDFGTNYSLDTKKLKKMINDSEAFKKLQKEALIIRDADAMSSVATLNGNTIMQTGNVAVVENKALRTNYDSNLEFEANVSAFNEPMLSKAQEIDSLTDNLMTPEGVYLDNGDVSSGVMFHAGELNTKFSSITDGEYYKATMSLVEPNQVPHSSLHSIKERIGEIKTYSNCTTREIEITLPKEAEGTILGNWYKEQLGLEIGSIRSPVNNDLEKGIIDAITHQKQMDFLNNIKIVYK